MDLRNRNDSTGAMLSDGSVDLEVAGGEPPGLMLVGFKVGYRAESELALGVRAGHARIDDQQVAEVIRGLAESRLKVANPKYR